MFTFVACGVGARADSAGTLSPKVKLTPVPLTDFAVEPWIPIDDDPHHRRTKLRLMSPDSPEFDASALEALEHELTPHSELGPIVGAYEGSDRGCYLLLGGYVDGVSLEDRRPWLVQSRKLSREVATRYAVPGNWGTCQLTEVVAITTGKIYFLAYDASQNVFPHPYVVVSASHGIELLPCQGVDDDSRAKAKLTPVELTNFAIEPGVPHVEMAYDLRTKLRLMPPNSPEFKALALEDCEQVLIFLSWGGLGPSGAGRDDGPSACVNFFGGYLEGATLEDRRPWLIQARKKSHELVARYALPDRWEAYKLTEVVGFTPDAIYFLGYDASQGSAPHTFVLISAAHDIRSLPCPDPRGTWPK